MVKMTVKLCEFRLPNSGLTCNIGKSCWVRGYRFTRALLPTCALLMHKRLAMQKGQDNLSWYTDPPAIKAAFQRGSARVHLDKRRPQPVNTARASRGGTGKLLQLRRWCRWAHRPAARKNGFRNSFLRHREFLQNSHSWRAARVT